jgi:pimeloyl-ACP methyl ester carboxylesterase
MSEQLPLLVLLPGMDGTGELFNDLLQNLGTKLQTRVINYPRDEKLSYQQLQAFVLERLPKDQPFVLLGESFSGPIAIALASQALPYLSGLILCATFCRNPQKLLSPFYYCLDLISPRLIPRMVLERIMFGRCGGEKQRQQFFESLYSVKPSVIQARCKEVLGLDYSGKLTAIDVPVLYLQGQYDHLVSSRSATELKNMITTIETLAFPTAHMLLQTEPKMAAQAILKFVRESLSYLKKRI